MSHPNQTAKLSPTFNDHAKALSLDYERLSSPEERIRRAHDWVKGEAGQNLVLSSSFGPQSILMLNFVKEAGIDIPVIAVDIEGDEYEPQRAYRETLRRSLGFDLYLAHAKDENGKDAAMIRALRQVNAGGVISGIRRSQTENRASKPYVEWREKNRAYSFHPILNWPDQGVDSVLSQQIDPALLHPDYAPGVQAIGGRILGAGEQKQECGLHIDGGGI